ncbi:MAG: hypothetical protein ACJ8AO_06290, partial [Gemmatimonadaceae bacterium]
ARVASPAPVTPPAGPVVRWTPDGPELVVRFTRAPSGGSLVLVRSADARASAQVVAGATTPLLVAPKELRVGGGTVASYRVALPAAVAAVRLRAPGRPERRLAPPRAADSVVVALPE